MMQARRTGKVAIHLHTLTTQQHAVPALVQGGSLRPAENSTADELKMSMVAHPDSQNAAGRVHEHAQHLQQKD